MSKPVRVDQVVRAYKEPAESGGGTGDALHQTPFDAATVVSELDGDSELSPRNRRRPGRPAGTPAAIAANPALGGAAETRTKDRRPGAVARSTDELVKDGRPVRRPGYIPDGESSAVKAMESRVEVTKSNIAAAMPGMTPKTFAPLLGELAADRWSDARVADTVRALERAYPDVASMTVEDARQLVRLRDLARDAAPWTIDGAMRRARPIAEFFRSRGIPWTPADPAGSCGPKSFTVDVESFIGRLEAARVDGTKEIALDKWRGRTLALALRDAVDDRQITAVKRYIQTEGLVLTGEGGQLVTDVLDKKQSWRLDRLDIVDAARKWRRGGFKQADYDALQNLLAKHEGDLETLAFARRFTRRMLARHSVEAPAAMAAARAKLERFFADAIPANAWIKYDELNRLARLRFSDPWKYYASRAAVVTSSSREQYELAVEAFTAKAVAELSASLAEEERERAEHAAEEHLREREVALDLERREQAREVVVRREARTDEEKRDVEVDAFQDRQLAALGEVAQARSAGGVEQAHARQASAQAGEADAKRRQPPRH